MPVTSDIWPEVAGVLFGLLLSVSLKIRYSEATEANTYFRQMCYAVTFTAFLDLYTTALESIVFPHRSTVYLIHTTFFYISNVITAYFLMRYIIMRIGRQNGRFFKSQRYLLYADILLVLTNLPVHWLFSYSAAGTIEYRPLHLVVSYGVSFFFLIATCVVQTIYSGDYTPMQLFVLRFAGFSLLGAFILQFFFFRNLVFSYTVGIFSVYLIFYAVEMPVYRRLEDAVFSLNAARQDLEEAAQAAKAASKAKSTFLANTSHEIRTPMNAIMGINEMIGAAAKEKEMKEASDEIRTAGMSLLQIINDVLDYSRIESGKMQLVRSSYALSDILMECAGTWKSVIEDKGISFAVEVAEDVPDDLYGDQDKLRQILNNLLSNAAKYTEKGRILLRIDLTTDKDDDFLNASVVDTGAGIRAEELDKIFYLFTRAAIDENINKPGAGLGLNISREMAHIMGGDLTVQSLYGQGSSFTLRIPLDIRHNTPFAKDVYEEKVSRQRQEETAPTFTAKGKRILVVDDTVVNLTVARGLLRPTFAQVDAALSGNEGLQLAAHNAYDLVFLDHMMPEMDGIEMLQKLRQMNGYEKGRVPVIALTSNTDETARQFYLDAGFDDYLAKPMQAKTLMRMLRNYL